MMFVGVRGKYAPGLSTRVYLASTTFRDSLQTESSCSSLLCLESCVITREPGRQASHICKRISVGRFPKGVKFGCGESISPAASAGSNDHLASHSPPLILARADVWGRSMGYQ